jgi:hypothetical protein
MEIECAHEECTKRLYLPDAVGKCVKKFFEYLFNCDWKTISVDQGLCPLHKSQPDLESIELWLDRWSAEV